MTPPAARPAGEPAPEPRALVVARVAELAFFLVTVFFAFGLSAENGTAERMVLARLLFDSLVALVIFLAMGLRPRPAAVAAVVFAGYVLLGCASNLPHVGAALAAPEASSLMALALVLGSCACQLVVLVACLSLQRPRGSA